MITDFPSEMSGKNAENPDMKKGGLAGVAFP